jgi:CheY-like chemotaxis protein
MNINYKSILCVDDDQDDLIMLREVIQEMGRPYKIIEAFDGLIALDVLKKMQTEGNLPCLIVLDINMPRMDGKQTLVAIQNDPVLATIPIVVFSTSSSAMDKTFCAAKKVEMITKPFDYTTLYTVANQLLSYCA